MKEEQQEFFDDLGLPERINEQKRVQNEDVPPPPQLVEEQDTDPENPNFDPTMWS